MPRAIWTGSISFGLVNVPVKLYSAIEQKDIHFSQFEEGTGAKIRYKRVSEKSGKEVPYEKIVKGYEVSKGKFVIVTPEDLEAAEPEATRTIDIDDFVDLEDIDPIFYEKTYYLAPASDDAGAKRAYALLLKAMEEKKKVGVGKFVMRTKQYLGAIRPLDGVLALSTMVFGDEVRDRKEIEELAGAKSAKVGDREVAMAEQIIESLSVEWDPSRYHDTYREKVLEVIERKAEGEEIVATGPARQEAEVVDLMAALEASLAAAKKGVDPKIEAATSSKSGDGGGGGDEDYDDMTKDELLELARDRDLAGRSKMSKDQLVKALRKTEQRAAS
jgi:DNA end-binding protein Ku